MQVSARWPHPSRTGMFIWFCFYRLLVGSGPDGINKVIDRFIEKYPDYSKRQVEIKINEVASKEKREEDNIKVWHIKPEFDYYLHMEEQPLPSDNTSSNVAGSGKKSAVKDKKEESSSKSTKVKSTVSEVTTGEKEKAKSKEGATSTKTTTTPAKRKAVDANLDEEPEVSSPVGNAAKEPKKAKTAFGLFVKAKRPEAEAKLGPDASVREILWYISLNWMFVWYFVENWCLEGFAH